MLFSKNSCYADGDISISKSAPKVRSVGPTDERLLRPDLWPPRRILRAIYLATYLFLSSCFSFYFFSFFLNSFSFFFWSISCRFLILTMGSTRRTLTLSLNSWRNRSLTRSKRNFLSLSFHLGAWGMGSGLLIFVDYFLARTGSRMAWEIWFV